MNEVILGKLLLASVLSDSNGPDREDSFGRSDGGHYARKLGLPNLFLNRQFDFVGLGLTLDRLKQKKE